MRRSNVDEAGHGRQNPRVRVAGIIVQNDEILLVRHEKEGKSYWLVPGGGVYYGETLRKALKREILEETGLEVEPKEIHFVNDSIEPGGGRHIINMYFDAEVLGGTLEVGADPRLVELKYFSENELEHIVLYPDVRGELRRYLRGESVEEVYLGSRWRE